MVEVHGVGRLEDRFADDGGDFRAMRVQDVCERGGIGRAPSAAEGAGWLVGEEVRLDYMYHIQQGANFNRGMNEILKANYINPAKMTRRQYNDAVELFWNAAEQIRKNIEESRSKESQ